MDEITCALVIGHSARSPGAFNPTYGITEFEYNEKLSLEIVNAVRKVRVIRVYREHYSALPEKINDVAPDFIICLHCNAYNRVTSGTEVLYYHHSTRGKELARIVHRNLIHALYLPNRGIKPVTTEGRGGFILRHTTAPAVIAEPFFIDNDRNLRHAKEYRDELVKGYAMAIEQYARYHLNG